MTACDGCLRRTDLIAALAGRLQVQFKTRGAPPRVLALPDDALLAVAAGPGVARRYAGFDAAVARRAAHDAGLVPVCRCSRSYPRSLLDLPDPPAVLHVLGEPAMLEEACAVALVGARRASTYGTEVARALGRGLSVARVAVVSGLALGVDSAAHAGALDGPGVTIGVLAGSAHVPYPARGHRLHAAVARRGAVVSELPPGAATHRWCFVARNRIIAALSAATVVVQAAARSGSLTTADFAADIGRGVGAVPGQITSRLAAGGNGLIQAGAALVSGVADVLEMVGEPAGPSATEAPGHKPADLRAAGSQSTELAAQPAPQRPPGELAALLSAVEEGRGTLGELAATPEAARAALAGLGRLERLGFVRRGFGGRWERTA